ncbi:hypothetical protein MN086_04950 [Sulfurovum sp. XGS-02]|uniref:hypothetical protein n=1 Tax=Sulfurovum sp. XGS-02 TaxID=2925411 RepID=UPI002045EC3E|nr:hypothetical protein [Sulfurovum sp. XGS-02]UPT78497.1 hypothetical protein MN086_04950 [Sulfurovum sp. XGS-02]
MKKLLTLTTIASFLLVSNGFAASKMTTKEEKMASTIQNAATENGWTQYKPAMHNASQSLYFKKSIKNKDYYTYRYQNRHQNKRMTVYAKVDYTADTIQVEFVDKIAMNPGRLGIDNRVDRSLDELKEAISMKLAAD